MLDLTFALSAISSQETGVAITPTDVETLLQGVRGASMASFTTVTDAKLAAKHKDVTIKKVTVASIQLFNNLKDFSKVYKDAVKRSAMKLGISEIADIEDFKPSDTYFAHTPTFSLCKHNEKESYYLFAIYNSSKSVYVMDGKIVDKLTVASFMTPSEAKKLLEPSKVVHNVTNDVVHDVTVRTPKLESIVRLSADKRTIIV